MDGMGNDLSSADIGYVLLRITDSKIHEVKLCGFSQILNRFTPRELLISLKRSLWTFTHSADQSLLKIRYLLLGSSVWKAWMDVFILK